MRRGHCVVDECEAEWVVAREMCERHYRRWRRHGDPLAGRVPPGSASGFIQRLASHEGDECVLWPFAVSDGYGRIGQTTAHSVVCELVHGQPPDGHQVAHSCGVGACVNPHHLRWALPVENAADKQVHGTENVGVRNGSAKLNDDMVRRIRIDRRDGATLAELAGRFGVTFQTVSRVCRGESWRHV